MNIEKQIVNDWTNKIFEAISKTCDKDEDPLLCYEVHEGLSAVNLVAEFDDYFTKKRNRRNRKNAY